MVQDFVHQQYEHNPHFLVLLPINRIEFAGDEAQRVEEWTTGCFVLRSRFVLGGKTVVLGFLGFFFWWVRLSLWQQNCVFLKMNLRRPYWPGRFQESLTNRIQFLRRLLRTRIFVVFSELELERAPSEIHWVCKIRSPIRLAQGSIFMDIYIYIYWTYRGIQNDTPIHQSTEPLNLMFRWSWRVDDFADLNNQKVGKLLSCFKPRPCWPSVVPLHRYRAGGWKDMQNTSNSRPCMSCWSNCHEYKDSKTCFLCQ